MLNLFILPLLKGDRHCIFFRAIVPQCFSETAVPSYV
jgi:hypothetical protein